jgi:hypothetical protein
MLPDRVFEHHRKIMIELSRRLKDVIAGNKHAFDGISDNDAAKPTHSGGWSRKQILGHLIDSASNNHQRFVRAMLQAELRFPRYDPEGSVTAQRYQEMSWEELTNLWATYNFFLTHVLASVPDAKRSTPCFIGDNPVMTLEELAADYIVHMRHHLDQIKSRI